MTSVISDFQRRHDIRDGRQLYRYYLRSKVEPISRELLYSLCTFLSFPMSLKDYKHLRDSTNDLIAFLGAIENGSTGKHPAPTSLLACFPTLSSIRAHPQHRLALALTGSAKSEFITELLSDLDKVPESWNDQGKETLGVYYIFTKRDLYLLR